MNYFVQRWARAYRDNTYYAAIDTNNGTEAQNRLFKYSFLPRKNHRATLSSTRHYCWQDPLGDNNTCFRIINNLLYIGPIIVTFHLTYIVHNRPRSIIIHCLDRQTNSAKISASQIHDIDIVRGVFELEKSSGKKHTVDFAFNTLEKMTSCTFSVYLHTNRLGNGTNFLNPIYKVRIYQLITKHFMSTSNHLMTVFPFQLCVMKILMKVLMKAMSLRMLYQNGWDYKCI